MCVCEEFAYDDGFGLYVNFSFGIRFIVVMSGERREVTA